jgi:hypothetical protein
VTGIADVRRSGFWANVVFHGLALAALIFILKYFQIGF